jgi:hypothetical protein
MTKFLRSFKHIFFSSLSLIIVAGAAAQPRLAMFGLEGQKITAIAVNKWPYQSQSFVVAATESSGVFLRIISDEKSDWQYLGLKGKQVVSLCVQGAGAGPMEYNIIYAGLQTDYSDTTTALVYRFSFPLDSLWQQADSGLNRDMHRVDALAAFDYSGHSPPQPVYCASGGSIYKYEDGVWQVSMPGSLLEYQINFIKEYDAQELWAGGSSGDFTYTPILMHSTDGGEKWELVYPYPDSQFVGPNTCLSFYRPWYLPSMIFTGMENYVLQSDTYTEEWSYTGLKDMGVRFTGLTGGLDNWSPLFAGGSDTNNAFALYEGFYLGHYWQKIETDSVLPAITCLISDTEVNWQDSISIFIGTRGAGVMLFKDAMLWDAIKDFSDKLPNNENLLQNYPNPFNPQTTIRYSVGANGISPKMVELSIYNITGQKVCTLVSGMQSAGQHEVIWDGTDEAGKSVASGIYFYRIKTGDFVQTKRMLLMR